MCSWLMHIWQELDIYSGLYSGFIYLYQARDKALYTRKSSNIYVVYYGSLLVTWYKKYFLYHVTNKLP